MDDILRKTLLYDFYGELLTAKRQKLFEAYYSEDFTLTEVGENFSVTRQAVHDILSRTEAKLESYESKLKLIDKYQQRKQLLEQLKIEINNLSDSKSKQKIINLVNELEKIE